MDYDISASIALTKKVYELEVLLKMIDNPPTNIQIMMELIKPLYKYSKLN